MSHPTPMIFCLSHCPLNIRLFFKLRLVGCSHDSHARTETSTMPLASVRDLRERIRTGRPMVSQVGLLHQISSACSSSIPEEEQVLSALEEISCTILTVLPLECIMTSLFLEGRNQLYLMK